MKKVLFLLTLFLLLVGCSNIKTDTLEDLVNQKVKNNYTNKVFNVYHKGYKYYLPKGLSIKTINESNEIITTDKFTYYLYVDLVSINDDVKIEYEIDNQIYKSFLINYEDNTGYVKIKEASNKYLVEILYNYAKIEVIVDREDLNVAVNNAMVILTTIRYNKDIIANLLKDSYSNYKDESLNLFDKDAKEDNFIKYEEQYDDYESTIPDYDVIN